MEHFSDKTVKSCKVFPKACQGLFASDKEKMLYNLDTTDKCYETFFFITGKRTVKLERTSLSSLSPVCSPQRLAAIGLTHKH